MGKNFLVSEDGVITAILEIDDMDKFDVAAFLKESKKNGFRVQEITDIQRDILMPKDSSLN